MIFPSLRLSPDAGTPIAARHRRWLDAAGIVDPDLRAAYERCRRLHAGFGRTYYLATLLLPAEKRPYVNSLYGFARYADEIVDNGDPATKEGDLTRWSDQVLVDLASGRSSDPVCRALLHTLEIWDIPIAHIQAFLRSMLMDLTVTEYQTYADLQEYMYGSAAVIGLQMVPILEPLHDEAAHHAATLGEAFQMTNFVRDVAEDLRRGRIYFPMADLDSFGVTRADLMKDAASAPVRSLIQFEIARTRKLYKTAEDGIALLAKSSRPCIRAAFVLYQGILDEVERADYQILDNRVSVRVRRRAGVAATGYLQARWNRIRSS